MRPIDASQRFDDFQLDTMDPDGGPPSRPPDAAIRANAALISAGMESFAKLAQAAAAPVGLNLVISGSQPSAARPPEKISSENSAMLARQPPQPDIEQELPTPKTPKDETQADVASSPTIDHPQQSKEPTASDRPPEVSSPAPQPIEEPPSEDPPPSPPPSEHHSNEVDENGCFEDGFCM